jgi:ABC-2 type transport system ATP-binding protein
VQDGSGRIVVQNLTKNFGQVAAVQNLSFQVEPGSVTGFLGPNGSGKTTTLRMLLGLVTPTAGFSTINGQPFNHLGNPARVVGGVLEAQGFHPGRTARDHLLVYGAAIGMPDQRADEILNLVGLAAAANRAAGGFSLGMKQRLALATALLGDPQVLVLDEPANGLDPEGIAWLRSFLKAFAQSGRTVLISSHLLAEVEQTIDHVVIISRGQTMYNGPLDDLRKQQQSRVIVQPADPQKLADALVAKEIGTVSPTPDGRLAVVGATVQQIGDIAAEAGVALYGVQEERADLEQLFLSMTRGQYAGQPPYAQGPPPGWGGPPPGYQQPGYAQGPPQGYQQPPPGWQPQAQTPAGGWQQPVAQVPQTPAGGWQQPAPQAPQTPGEGWQQPAPQAPQTPGEGWQQPTQQAPGQQAPAGSWQQPAPQAPTGGWQQPATQTPAGGWEQQAWSQQGTQPPQPGQQQAPQPVQQPEPVQQPQPVQEPQQPPQTGQADGSAQGGGSN